MCYVDQKELIGVGQGTTAQVLEMLHEAAVHGVHSCETKIYDFGQFNEALSAASNCKYANVVLKV